MLMRLMYMERRGSDEVFNQQKLFSKRTFSVLAFSPQRDTL
jgi:hypothetical protein